MQPKIPLVVTIEEANALIDVWEALQHADAELTDSRYDKAFEIIDWLRRSITAVGKPPRHALPQLLLFTLLSWRMRIKFKLLRWKNRHAIHALMLTREERAALLRFLVLHTPAPDLYPVIERLRGLRDARGHS